MKNILKIFLAIALVLCMSIAMFACTDNEPTGTPTGNTGEENTESGGNGGGEQNDDDNSHSNSTEGTVGGNGGVAPGDNWSPVRPGVTTG